MKIGEAIKNEAMKQGRSVKWMSDALNCSRFNIYDIYSRETIDTEMLFRISKLLKRDFFELYSERYRKGMSDQ